MNCKRIGIKHNSLDKSVSSISESTTKDIGKLLSETIQNLCYLTLSRIKQIERCSVFVNIHAAEHTLALGD